MEGGLLVKEKDDKRSRWRVLLEEMKKLEYIAGPMVAVTLSQYFLQVTSVTMFGHLGELALSSTSISGVTGFSLIMGMSSALETLCGQAYGAQQYTKFANQTYTAIFSLLVVCVPLAIFWRYTETLLILVGQSPLISHEAGKFIIWLIPALFAYAILQLLVRYFQMQSMLLPMLASSVAALCLHVPLCWTLVYKIGSGNIGGAVSIAIAMWLNVIFLLFYMMYSPKCAKTRSPVSLEVFHGMRRFFSFAIPSAVMICLEWWSYELLVLLSGLLPNPELETSVLAVCLNTIATLYAIPFGFAAAVSTRVSNELGAGNPRGARVAVHAIMILTIVETTIVSTSVFVGRHVFGYIFTSKKEVVDYITKMAPLICLNILMDGLQGTLSGYKALYDTFSVLALLLTCFSCVYVRVLLHTYEEWLLIDELGVARGVGWQHLGAYTNLAAYYLVGIPVAAFWGFCTLLRGEGMSIGILGGCTLQVILLSVVTLKNMNRDFFVILKSFLLQ